MKLTEIRNITKRSKKKEDRTFNLLITQIVICVLIIITALIIKFIGGEIYKKTREKYIGMFNDKTSVSEVLQTVAKTFEMKAVISSEESSEIIDSSSEPEQETSSSEVSQEESSPPETEVEGTEDKDSGQMVYSQVQSHLKQTGMNINTMIMPAKGRISDEFGYRVHPLSGEYRMHNGLDIAADSGTDIWAAYDGIVTKTGEASDYGKYIILKHANGLETLYGHCSKIVAKEGYAVKKGDVIALVGSTGVSTGPHCHFEIRVNGSRIDPRILLQSAET